MSTYVGNSIADLDVTTPTTGTWTVPEVDDALREIKRALKTDGLRKVIEIGDWNMDATSFKNVTHGLTASKIRSITGVIRDDANTTYRGITALAITGAPAYIDYWNSTIVSIARTTSGTFDSTDFDTAASYNRGWITIFYEE